LKFENFKIKWLELHCENTNNTIYSFRKYWIYYLHTSNVDKIARWNQNKFDIGCVCLCVSRSCQPYIRWSSFM